MYVHMIVFVVPWIVFWIISDKNKLRKLFVSGTFGAIIALVVDIVQHSFQWWSFKEDIIPGLDIELSADLGLYPVQAMLLVQYLPKNKLNWHYWIIGISIFNTLGEYILVKIGQLAYTNGWNIIWTFISYIIPFTLVALHSIFYANKSIKNS